ncbi:MAG: glycosyltransferase family 4 protein [Acidimicrobiia bacterium]
MANRSVAIVHLGRSGGLGTHRRVESLTALFEAAGGIVTSFALRADYPAHLTDALRPGIVPLLTGGAVPETLSWSRHDVLQALQELAPEVVVCVTGRAYHPDLGRGPWNLVLDYVDRLSDSYRDRARILGRTGHAAAYRVLALTAVRQERRTPPGTIAIAAGWRDSQSLGVDWVPITVESPATLETITPEYDMGFFGTLSYEPNIEALRRCATIWPLVRAERPDARMLVAGATPPPEVERLAREFGWTLLANVPDMGRALRTTLIAVAPLVHASGLQIKVLEAAAFGVAQVVDPVALGGFLPGFPAAVASDDRAFARTIVGLLSDPTERDALVARARALVASDYSVERWAPWAEHILRESVRT